MASVSGPHEWSVRRIVTAIPLTPLGWVGVVALTVPLSAVYGGWGLLVGLSVLGAALVSPGPAAFVVAQLGIISLVPLSDGWLLVATQCAAFPLLASAACDRSPSPQRLGRLAAVYVVSLGTVWILQMNLRWLWHAALTVTALAAAVVYALHRYERVTVGLVTTDGEQ